MLQDWKYFYKIYEIVWYFILFTVCQIGGEFNFWFFQFPALIGHKDSGKGAIHTFLMFSNGVLVSFNFILSDFNWKLCTVKSQIWFHSLTLFMNNTINSNIVKLNSFSSSWIKETSEEHE